MVNPLALSGYLRDLRNMDVPLATYQVSSMR